MSKGLKVPVQVDARGRTIVIDKDEQASKIIKLSLGDNDNDNAFQQSIGLGLGHVFDVANPGFRAQVLSKLFQIFRDFEEVDLFRLERNSIKWSGALNSGQQTLEFRYINLESDEPETFSQTFAPRS